ncbi:MAG: hypothetical protein OXG85_02790 [Chloroflexi bacterium]|nr:hypothetical protein [Chloroflexota bacterium]
MKSRDAQIVNHAETRRGRRGWACLFWGFGGFICLLSAFFIAVFAVYAGWSSGLATARADSAAATHSEIRVQCQHIPKDLAEHAFRRAQRRFEELEKQAPQPACLGALAPTATAAFLLAVPSPTTAPPTMTATQRPSSATPLPSTALPTTAPTLAPASDDGLAEYDLEALLLEAQQALSLQNYNAAIDTLDAIISIDRDYQRDLTRRLLLEALKAQALALYRGGRLSEAIVLTDRAEEYGNIDDLSYERFIALMYLDGQRYKVANPAESVRKFSSMVYEFGVRDYVNGSVATELQEAHRNYALALALQGDHCPAQAQFQAALDLRPAVSHVNPADLVARRDQAALACQAQRQGAVTELTPNGQGDAPTHAPVGYAG